MKIGVYGGAFDPPHLSHVLAVGYALTKGNFDQILVVPCWNHAFGKKMSSFEDRYQMCLKAFSIYGMRVQVLPIEAELKTSFTVNLMEYLRLTYDEDDLHLIIGEDEARVFDKWHRHQDILRMANLFILGREDYQSATAEPLYRLPNLSSTYIKNEIASKGLPSMEPFLPFKVYKYIQENHLYENSPLS